VDLPGKDYILYLVQGHYLVWENKRQTSISVRFPVFNRIYTVKNDFVKYYGARSAPTLGAVLVDNALLARHPTLAELVTTRRTRK
jgi:hypothetical protein